MTSKQPINTPSSIKRTLESTPRLCLYLLLIFTPLARGSVQGWAITTIHFISLIALSAFLIDKTLYGGWEWIKTPLNKPILALMILCGISFSFSVYKYTSFWAMMLLMNYIIIFYLVIHTIRTQTQLIKLVYILIGIGIFLTIFGLFKKIGLNPFPWWHYPEIKSEMYRLSATFGNANHLAGYMEMTLLLILGLLLSGFRGINRAVLAGSILLFMVAVTLSLSRGAWVSALAGLLFMISISFSKHFSQKKWLFIPLIIGLLVVGLVVLSYTPTVKRVGAITEFEQATNFQSRIYAWRGIINMIKDYPFFGTGPGTFAIIFTQYQPPGLPMRYFYAHNDYLHLAAEMGLPAAGVIIWFILMFYRAGIKTLTRGDELNRNIAFGAMAGITAMLVHSLVDFNLHIPANALLFIVLSALVVAPFKPTENISIH